MRKLAACGRWKSGTVLSVCLAGAASAGVDPWADRVVSFDGGSNPIAAYANPNATLGPPERFTGEGVFDSAVTMFNPAFGPDELFSIGDGGHLVVEFDEPVTNGASHLFGVDLIVFTNSFFVDMDYPNGQIGDPALTFAQDALRLSVSENGVDFVLLGEFGQEQFPTQGYLDVPALAFVPGDSPTDFTRPVNPALSLSDFAGLSYAEALALYDGSGGGLPIDIGPSGLSSVRYVRVEAGPDAASGATVEIDGFAAVPEPGSLALLSAAVLLSGAVRRKG